MKNRWVRCDSFVEVADEFFEVVRSIFFFIFDVDEYQKTKERSGDGEEMGFDLGLDFLVVDDDGRTGFESERSWLDFLVVEGDG